MDNVNLMYRYFERSVEDGFTYKLLPCEVTMLPLSALPVWLEKLFYHASY